MLRRDRRLRLVGPPPGLNFCRTINGPGVHEPLVWYEGSALGNTGRRYLLANHQGSIVGITDATGAMLRIKSMIPMASSTAPAAAAKLGLYPRS